MDTTYTFFDEDSFEENCQENGFTYWWGSQLMTFLGYEGWGSFLKAINKAIATCNSLNIQILDNFIQTQRVVDGKAINDYKLSRFACYLTVMNGDSKKPSVAKAQVYFASLAGAVSHYLQQTEQVERLQVRDEITEREKCLTSVVYQAGVTEYGLFQNAGYRGMYNKNLSQLKAIRHVDSKRSLLDFMGKDELAANLFRITQTEMKIRKDNVRGQRNLEFTAESVGRKVRDTMIEISGTSPENLAPHEDIKEVRKSLKKQGKELKKIDSGKKNKK